MTYKKIIFVCRDNVCQSPAAEAIMKSIISKDIEVTSRGTIVLFPEPYNPKIRSVLRSNGIIMENGTSKQISEDDFEKETLILTMDREDKLKILNEYETCKNVYTIMEFCGGSGDIMDPYGGDSDVYTLFFDAINSWVCQVNDKINEQGE